MAGENGGGAFLIIYIALVFTLGLSVMLCEFVIGRAAERNPVGAFDKLKGGRWKFLGFLGVAAGFIILSFYHYSGLVFLFFDIPSFLRPKTPNIDFFMLFFA